MIVKMPRSKMNSADNKSNCENIEEKEEDEKSHIIFEKCKA